MEKLNDQQLIKVQGGAFSSTILNSISKAVSTIFSYADDCKYSQYIW